MGKLVIDPYEKIRKLLPLNTRLGFVFDLEQRDDGKKLVVYYDGHGVKPQKLLFENNTLTHLDEVNAMMDDGLSGSSHRASTTFDFDQLITNQYNEASRTDSKVIELLLGESFSNKKIARGLDVVCVKVAYRTRDYVLDRNDWDLADSILVLFQDYPVLSGLRDEEDSQVIVENAEYVLAELIQFVANARHSTLSRRVIEASWSSVKHNLAVAQYHPTLSSLYWEMSDVTKNYMLGAR